MNKIQKNIIKFGLIVFVLITICPPWIETKIISHKERVINLGYHFPWGVGDSDGSKTISVNMKPLLLEYIIIGVITVGLIVLNIENKK